MDNRQKKRGDDDGSRAPAFVDRLPFTPPVLKDEWQGKPLTELVGDQVFLDYHDRCFHEIIASGRIKKYIDILSMIAHIGRLPEFDEPSYGRFLKEARGQHFSEPQMTRALDLILSTSGPGELLPNAAAAWEFLAFVGDFVGQYAEHTDAGPDLKQAVERVNAMSIMAFLVAVNAELGIRKDFW
jgi:hypothetical protein